MVSPGLDGHEYCAIPGPGVVRGASLSFPSLALQRALPGEGNDREFPFPMGRVVSSSSSCKRSAEGACMGNAERRATSRILNFFAPPAYVISPVVRLLSTTMLFRSLGF